MLPKACLLVVSIIGLCLPTAHSAGDKATQTDARHLLLMPDTSIATATATATPTPTIPAIATTTTGLPLPLQPPPMNVTSTTTSSFLPMPRHTLSVGVAGERFVLAKAKAVAAETGEDDSSSASNAATRADLLTALSDSDEALNKQPEQPQGTEQQRRTAEHESDEPIAASSNESSAMEQQSEEYLSASDAIFLPTLPTSQTVETAMPAQHSATPNGHGYIQFEIHDELPAEAVEQRERQSKSQTVNEVLLNLFPKGFSDIFRFSYPADTTTEAVTEAMAAQSTTTQAPSTSTTATTTAAVALPNTTERAIKPNQTFYSYQTTVTKEYRRELQPGHTQIIVEKIAGVPRIASEGFKDGTNHISKDELLRINRAAVDAPVLPSMLLKPSVDNDTDSTGQRQDMQAPIIILNDNSDSELDESMSIEDNQIAETQHVGQQHYQQTVLPAQRHIESYRSQLGPGHDQPINVHIVHDQSLAKAQHENYVSAPPPHPEKALDLFQLNTEKHFQQRYNAQEAPSRAFLKSFKPMVSDSVNGPIPKGIFHYEANGPQNIVNTRPPTPQDYAGPYVRPAAQLVYHREQQAQQAQQAQQELSKLHTSFVASPPEQAHAPMPQQAPAPEKAPAHYTPVYGPTPPPSQPNSVVFVTLNTPNPPNPPQHGSHALHNEPAVDVSEYTGPSPHEYVAEAAAAPSQTQLQHVPAPKPSGYTFVEVQKSVNIHNKLITEKDGRLVEQHETIYHPTHYQKNQLANFSPKDYVSSVATAVTHPPAAPTSAHAHAESPNNYVSLSSHPINVDYESEPHESAVSHATIQFELDAYPSASQDQHAAKNTAATAEAAPREPAAAPLIFEKVVPQPYPVPVEKYIDRPVPVIHEVEKQVPQPYPVKEYVEKLVDRPVPVEKVVDRPVQVPYAVPVDHYVDRPYPVKEIVEKHIAIPYAVPEPVAVPVHIPHYIDRPYPVETIVEKPVPYPVETVVEKIVEKEVPVEVERIVEKPVEKTIEKFVDRPVAIPIHVPVAIHMPRLPPSGPTLHSGPGFGFPPHPNELPPWSHSAPSIAHVPPKVLQNYYARMLKKLLPQMTTFKTTTVAPAPKSQLKTPRAVDQNTKLSFKPLSDMRFDLRPPPPPMGSQWLRGARYIYNTLPEDLTTAAAAAPTQLVKSYIGPVPGATAAAAAASTNTDFDEFQRWRNGHSLKRSPDFGRNLHVEYGFKPPLVPSVEIDDKGMPLKQGEQ